MQVTCGGSSTGWAFSRLVKDDWSHHYCRPTTTRKLVCCCSWIHSKERINTGYYRPRIQWDVPERTQQGFFLITTNMSLISWVLGTWLNSNWLETRESVFLNKHVCTVCMYVRVWVCVSVCEWVCVCVCVCVCAHVCSSVIRAFSAAIHAGLAAEAIKINQKIRQWIIHALIGGNIARGAAKGLPWRGTITNSALAGHLLSRALGAWVEYWFEACLKRQTALFLSDQKSLKQKLTFIINLMAVSRSFGMLRNVTMQRINAYVFLHFHYNGDIWER